MQPYFYTFLGYLRRMYLYNITLFIEPDQENEVVDTVRKFEKNPAWRFLKMLDSAHESATYCLQIQVADQQALSAFREGPFAALWSMLESRFPKKVMYYESVMEYL